MAGPSSVFTVAAPSPGKCFAVGATPPSRIPRTAARVRAATPRSSPANERVAMTEPARGTSATGARFTFTPASRSPRPVERAARRTSAGAPWKGWLAARPHVLHRADVAALLVDHDERPAVTGLAAASG